MAFKDGSGIWNFMGSTSGFYHSAFDLLSTESINYTYLVNFKHIYIVQVKLLGSDEPIGHNINTHQSLMPFYLCWMHGYR